MLRSFAICLPVGTLRVTSAFVGKVFGRNTLRPYAAKFLLSKERNATLG